MPSNVDHPRDPFAPTEPGKPYPIVIPVPPTPGAPKPFSQPHVPTGLPARNPKHVEDDDE